MVYVNTKREVSTDIYYKDTNSHDYLNFNSHHPLHIKKNIPYILAKRIIIITTDELQVENHLNDLRRRLIKCDYPKNIIERGIHNSRLQGPANIRSEKRVIPLISPFLGNYDNSNIVHITKSLIQNSKDERVRKVFSDTDFIEAYRQPRNLLRLVSNSKYFSNNSSEKHGIFKCERKWYKVCR